MLLIAGGESDPNLHALAQAATQAGVPWVDLRVPLTSSPPFHWDLTDPAAAPPWGDEVMPTGAFIRQDVFAPLNDPRPVVAQRAQGWSAALQGWLLAHPKVRVFNRDIRATAFNKPAALIRARACGLRTPDTWLSNDTARLRQRLAQGACIAKPAAGGGYCQTLDEALNAVEPGTAFSAMPALIQPRLVAPEHRVFVIGPHVLAFEVRSASLDYREHQDAEVSPATLPSVTPALRRLMDDFGMDFGAADFKTDPDTGEPVFLELNTSPMFARFDMASHGALCAAMIDVLAAA